MKCVCYFCSLLFAILFDLTFSNARTISDISVPMDSNLLRNTFLQNDVQVKPNAMALNDALFMDTTSRDRGKRAIRRSFARFPSRRRSRSRLSRRRRLQRPGISRSISGSFASRWGMPSIRRRVAAPSFRQRSISSFRPRGRALAASPPARSRMRVIPRAQISNFMAPPRPALPSFGECFILLFKKTQSHSYWSWVRCLTSETFLQ